MLRPLVWPSSGWQECGQLQGGKNVAIFRKARMCPSSGRQEQEYSHPEDGRMSGRNMSVVTM